MNKKLIVANLMLAVLASACGDSTYAPNGVNPNAQLGMIGNQNYPYYNQPNFQLPQNQNMLNNQLQWSTNWNTGWNTNWNTNWNTSWNYQPSTWMNCYGPNRNYIVSPTLRVYSPGRYVYVSRSGNSSCSTSVPVYTYRKVKTYHVQCVSCSDDNNSVTTPSSTNSSSTSNNTSSTSSTPANPSSTTNGETTKTVNVVWTGDTAEALYKRLNVKEEDLQGRRSAKRGSHLTCFEDRSGRNTYSCILNIDVIGGIVRKEEKPAERITDKDRGFYKAEAFNKDDTLVIGGDNRGLDEGILNLEGPTAKEIFENIKAEEKTIKVGVNNKEAVSKTLGQLQCYHTINTTRPTYYCSVKIQPSTGEVQDDFTKSPGSTEASDASNTGKTDQNQTEQQTTTEEVKNPTEEEKKPE